MPGPAGAECKCGGGFGDAGDGNGGGAAERRDGGRGGGLPGVGVSPPRATACPGLGQKDPQPTHTGNHHSFLTCQTCVENRKNHFKSKEVSLIRKARPQLKCRIIQLFYFLHGKSYINNNRKFTN